MPLKGENFGNYQNNIETSKKKKKNPLETSENDQNTHKLSQNTLDILDFEGILVDFKLHCSF